jgi:hypothetical protein
MKKFDVAADRLFLLLTAIALFQLCHAGMHWILSGTIAVAYYLLLDRRYGALEHSVS